MKFLPTFFAFLSLSLFYNGLLAATVFPLPHTRIYNGFVASERRPFMVALVLRKNGRPYFGCGGSVLNERWVLTAPHCMYDHNSGEHGEFAAAIKSGRAQAWIGAYDISVPEPPNVRQHITIRSAWETSPPWSNVTHRNDIALLELARPILEFGGSNFGAICIGRGGEDFKAQKVVFNGWGVRDCSDATRTASRLHEANGQTIPNSECKKTYLDLLTDKLICAKLVGAKGGYAQESGGDSGGPLWYHRAADERAVQVGISSFYRTTNGTTDCALRGAPGAYTRTSEYINWMKETMKKAYSTSTTVDVCD